MEYNVIGHVQVAVIVRVNAENANEAMEKAHEQLPELTAYSFNREHDAHHKMVGVAGENEHIYTDDNEIEYDEAKLVQVHKNVKRKYLMDKMGGKVLKVLEDEEE